MKGALGCEPDDAVRTSDTYTKLASKHQRPSTPTDTRATTRKPKMCHVPEIVVDEEVTALHDVWQLRLPL